MASKYLLNPEFFSYVCRSNQNTNYTFIISGKKCGDMEKSVQEDEALESETEDQYEAHERVIMTEKDISDADSDYVSGD